ncbi:hypothetical protein Tco_1078547 [Tanacetum coccineum]|uniref:Uncharacterized protein n=1 Tax=Tanacetum coccineum TaxID=301880 RepID=A0ABQ5HPB3_9ASTR
MTGESNSHLERAASTERCLQPWQVEDPLSRNCTRKSEPDRGSAKFSDDVLFFGEWSRANAKNLIHILCCYEAASGLKINFIKSRLFSIGVARDDVNGVASSLGCKLFAWKAKSLSESVLLGFQDNQHGFSWVKWKTILLDLDKGGLGVGGLLAKNLRLLVKWNWCFLTEKDALWRAVIQEFYGDDGRFGADSNIPNNLWCAGIPWLIDVFPRLYALESFKDLKVNNCWVCENRVWGQGTWAWHFPLRVRALNDLSPLIELIGNTTLSPEASTNGLGLMKLWHL